RLADPAGIRLGRDGVSQVLQAVEDVHGAVLDAVLVAGDQAAADPSVIGVLAGVVEQAGAGGETFGHLLHHGTVVAQPDGPGQYEDVGRQDLLVQVRPGVGLPAVLPHVGPDTGGDVVVHGPYDVDPHSLCIHDGGAAVDQSL